MTAVLQAGQTLGRPHDDVRQRAGEGLLTARAQVAPAVVAAAHPTHDPRAVGVVLPPLRRGDPLDRQPSLFTAAAVRTGHAVIVPTGAGRAAPGTDLPARRKEPR